MDHFEEEIPEISDMEAAKKDRGNQAPEDSVAHLDELLATLDEKYKGVDPGALAEYRQKLEEIRRKAEERVPELAQNQLRAGVQTAALESRLQTDLFEAFDSIKKELESGVSNLSITPQEQMVKKGETVLAILAKVLDGPGNEAYRTKVAEKYGVSADLKGNAFFKALLESDTENTFAYKWIYAGNVVRFEKDGTIRVEKGDSRKVPDKPPKEQ